MANAIYRGSYFHAEGTDARVSVVHAKDIAGAVAAIADGPESRDTEIYNLTDGEAPLRSELADALAWRMGQKRVLTMKAMIARIYFGSHKLRQLATDRRIDGGKFRRDYPDFRPDAVCEYLRTHVYDENSL